MSEIVTPGTGNGRSLTGGRRTAAAAVVFAMALTACGQKAGIHVEGSGAPLASAPLAAPVDTGETAFVDTSSADGTQEASVTSPEVADAPRSDSGVSTTPSSGGPAAPPANSQAPQTAPAPGAAPAPSSAPAQQSQKAQVRGSDRTGVTADKITIGTHAPVTGAAPLPSTSFEKSGDLYWRNITQRQGKTVLGRSEIEYLFRDDRYDPNSARQVCRELESETFIFAGGGGTDQIQACGAFAAQAKTPYFSAGVTEAGLRGNPWYFAVSMSYKQQGPLLAKMLTVLPETKGKKVAAIITDTPNFDDAIAGWESGVKAAGIDYYKTLTHPKGDSSWYNAYAADLAAAGVEVVFILSSPVDYIRFAQQANQNGFSFQYVGVGLSMGLNAVLNSGCDDVDGGIFFSPFPGLDHARTHVPDFFAAGAHFGVPTDDIAFALWGISAGMHSLLEQYGSRYGNDLTREDFRDSVENSSIETGVFPAVKFSAGNHFGAQSVHVLQADCSIGEYRTLRTFASKF